MHWRLVLLLSCLLGLTGCSTYPPCYRSDVTPAYDAEGHPLPESLTISVSCLRRIQGDLTACYHEAN